MLRITVELVPGGFEPLRRKIATMKIGNLSDLADRSDYQVQADESANPIAGLSASAIQVDVKDHDRRQSVWSLVAVAAAAVLKAQQQCR